MLILVFIVIAHLITASTSDNYFCSSSSSENEREVCDCALNCSFATLESTMLTDDNQYRLWTTFHHPRKAFPQLLVVTYYTEHSFFMDSDNETTKATYLWTSNSIYFVVPPQVFGLLTLFIGVLDNDHTGSVDITIPDNCSCWLSVPYITADNDATLNYLEVLTEKVKLCSTHTHNE